jgi:RNA polymerase sigma-70 factor (ECF subfamily)
MDLESELRDRFLDADERADAEASIALIARGHPDHHAAFLRYDGREATALLLEAAFGEKSTGEWRLIRADCNRMPAAISYVRRPGDTEFRTFKVDVIRAQDGKVREVTSFGVDLREAFGVPEVLHG